MTISNPTQIKKRSSVESLPKRRWSRKTLLATTVAAPLLVTGIYTLSIVWRVSWYQQMLFGRSALIPLSLTPRAFTDYPTTVDAYGTPTYQVEINGQKFAIHRQFINGYQHTFGSALASYEIGEHLADYIFRLNEYMEAYCWRDGQRYPHYRDTKKDLYNNSVGRRIGSDVRQLGLLGTEAERKMSDLVISAMYNKEVILHYHDPLVDKLPSLEDYGCPGLPKPKPD